MSKKILLGLLLTMSVAVTGCGANQTANTEAATDQVVSTETDKVAEEIGTVTVVHSLGETEVPVNPKNVAVFELGILDAMQALDIEVGGVPSSGTLPAYLEEYAGEEYANLGSLKEPDLEAIFELEPELIIIGGRQADYYEELSKIAPTISLAVDNADYMNSFKANMETVAEIFNKQDEIGDKITELEAKVAEVRELAEADGGTGLIALANDGAFSVYGQGSRFGIIHNDFGVPAVDQTIEVATHGQKASYEYIAEQNPDYIFVVDRTAAVGSGTGSAQEMFENDLMKTTKAYQNGNIIILDATAWYTAGGGFTSTQIMIDDVKAAYEKQ